MVGSLKFIIHLPFTKSQCSTSQWCHDRPESFKVKNVNNIRLQFYHMFTTTKRSVIKCLVTSNIHPISKFSKAISARPLGSHKSAASAIPSRTAPTAPADQNGDMMTLGKQCAYRNIEKWIHMYLSIYLSI